MVERATHRLRLLGTVVLSQLGWFCCVLGAAYGRVPLGLGLATLCLAGMLWISKARLRDLGIMLVAMMVGLVWDTGLARAGLVRYASPGPLAGLAPGWIVVMWALFGMLLREPLAWLHRRPLLAAGLGAVGGAASYAGAVRLGAGSFPDAMPATVVLMAGWAVLTPLLLGMARRAAGP